MAKRAAMALMTVMTGTAAADSTQVAVAPIPEAESAPVDDPVTPRLLPSGAPACGNVMFKSYRPQDAWCDAIDKANELRELMRKWQRTQVKHAVRTAALTLTTSLRPRL